MNSKMHKKNKKKHKTRKFKDQTKKIIKNNLKIMKNIMHEFSKILRKLKRMQLTPNLKIDTRLKQETSNYFWFYDFIIFFGFSKINFGKTKKEKRKIFYFIFFRK